MLTATLTKLSVGLMSVVLTWSMSSMIPKDQIGFLLSDGAGQMSVSQ